MKKLEEFIHTGLHFYEIADIADEIAKEYSENSGKNRLGEALYLYKKAMKYYKEEKMYWKAKEISEEYYPMWKALRGKEKRTKREQLRNKRKRYYRNYRNI